MQLPLFDINYGYGNHIQLNLNTSLINVNQFGVAQTSGLSVASLGVKWRFVDDELFGVAISSYPRIDFHQRFSSEAPVVNTPGTRYFLPIEFSKELGAFGINPEIGFASYTQFGSEWVYGLAMSYIHLQKKKRRYFRFMGARSSVLTTANYFSILELAIY